MKAKMFEDLVIWQQARDLARVVYHLTSLAPFSKDYGLKDQIQRAAVSVSSNIAEGFERNSDKEFVNFLFIAKGSCGEVRSQLQIASDLGYVSAENHDKCRSMCLGLSRRLSTTIRSVRASSLNGTRYKVMDQD